jgi:hypothetical protein
MTDELLYTKIARHIADTGSPLPVLHGEHVGFLGVVYSILLAPLYAAFDPVTAFDAAHVLNSVLFASAAIPIYLLARRVVPPECALVVALLSIAIPWAVNTATAMSEAAAYPVFAWAVLACHGALAEPSPRRDLLAIGGLALAFFTRPQFLVLAGVLVLAALVVDGPRQALRRHRVLAWACLAAVVIVVPLAAVGQTHRLLGDYGVTATEGSLLPAGVWKAAAIHLDVVAVGLGVLPFLLGTAWTYSNLRGGPFGARAFATFTAVALPLLALETASYDLRFGGAEVIRDRYLFYIAPLLLVATAAALVGRLPVWGLVGSTAFFAVTVATSRLACPPASSSPSAGSCWARSAWACAGCLVRSRCSASPSSSSLSVRARRGTPSSGSSRATPPAASRSPARTAFATGSTELRTDALLHSFPIPSHATGDRAPWPGGTPSFGTTRSSPRTSARTVTSRTRRFPPVYCGSARTASLPGPRTLRSSSWRPSRTRGSGSPGSGWPQTWG